MHIRHSFFAGVSAFMFMAPMAKAQDIVYSTDYVVEVGKPYPVIDGAKRYFNAENAVICVKNEGRRWFVQKLSSQGLDQISMKQYDDMPDGMAEEYVGYFGKRLMVFYSVWDKPNEREQLFYREIDTQAGAFLGKGERILAINGKVTGSLAASGFYRFHVTDKFDFIFSADESKLVVQYVRKRDKKKDDTKVNELSVAVFNDDMTMEWTADIRLPYEDNKMSIRDYTIDANGDICIVANVYTGMAEKAKERKDEDWQYEFLRCSGQGVNWDVTPLSIPDRTLMSLSIFEDETGALRAAGFYRKNKDQFGADGIFVCAFSASDDISELEFHEIPTELINMYVAKREAKRNAKEEDEGEDLGFSFLELSRVLTDTDGSMLLIGEKRYTTVECSTDSRGNTRCYTVWHADDMLVCSLDAKGALAWMKRIPKRHASRMPIATSYKYMYGGGAHHFIRFDEGDNLDIKPDEIPGSRGKTVIMSDRLDEVSGEVVRSAILDPEEVNGTKLYQLSLDRLVRVGNAEMLMEAYIKGKEDVLIRIAVKE